MLWHTSSHFYYNIIIPSSHSWPLLFPSLWLHWTTNCPAAKASVWCMHGHTAHISRSIKPWGSNLTAKRREGETSLLKEQFKALLKGEGSKSSFSIWKMPQNDHLEKQTWAAKPPCLQIQWLIRSLCRRFRNFSQAERESRCGLRTTHFSHFEKLFVSCFQAKFKTF